MFPLQYYIETADYFVNICVTRQTQTGVVCAGEAINQNDGGYSTGFVKAKALVGQYVQNRERKTGERNS
jgi:hypothetical protein